MPAASATIARGSLASRRMRPGFALALALGTTTLLAWAVHELEHGLLAPFAPRSALAALDPAALPGVETSAPATHVAGAETGPARGADFHQVDPGRVRLDGGAAWSDPRWDADLAQVLGSLASFDVEDSGAHEAVRARLALLPFVESVGAVEVLWPDGLRVPIVLRQPIACIATREQGEVGYWLVAQDGMILSGRWPSPPHVGGHHLPVLLGAHGAVEGARPGRIATSPLLRDALEISRQLPLWLEPAQLDVLGPVAIDARGAAEAGPEGTGIRLLLENQRLIAFGRSPLSNEPGELPIDRKWWSIARGLDALRSADERYDWELLDVRWDVPAWRLRGEFTGRSRGAAHAAGGSRRGG
jgi:hypothetical protein